jgi:hypothetical protein
VALSESFSIGLTMIFLIPSVVDPPLLYNHELTSISKIVLPHPIRERSPFKKPLTHQELPHLTPIKKKGQAQPYQENRRGSQKLNLLL